MMTVPAELSLQTYIELVAKMTVPVTHIRLAASASQLVRPSRICTGLKIMMREAGCAVGQ